MANEIMVTVRGYVGTDPELRSTSAGEIAEFRLGSTSSYRDKHTNEMQDGGTTWFRVKAWGEIGRNTMECVRKGTPVLVRGRISSRSWEDDNGNSRTSLEIVADALGVEISFGTAQYVRGKRGANESEKTIDEKERLFLSEAPQED